MKKTEQTNTADWITISRKRYGKLREDRDTFRFESNLWFLIAIIFIVISILISIFLMVNIGLSTKYEKEIETLKESHQMELAEVGKDTIKVYSTRLEEAENEIAQLRDRIVFLSLSPALYNSEELIDTGIEEEEEDETTMFAPILNWQEYINLFTIGQKVPLPEGIDTNTFRCMDYRTITDTTSWQYAIQILSKIDPTSGLRYYEYNGEKYYTVALATAYGIDLGNAYKVTLANGTTFNIIHAEYKHDIRYLSTTDFGDADCNYDGENTISVIEFIYDWMSAPQGLIDDGEANRWLGENCDIYGDGCNIVSMEYLGKIWNAS